MPITLTHDNKEEEAFQLDWALKIKVSMHDNASYYTTYTMYNAKIVLKYNAFKGTAICNNSKFQFSKSNEMTGICNLLALTLFKFNFD